MNPLVHLEVLVVCIIVLVAWRAPWTRKTPASIVFAMGVLVSWGIATFVTDREYEWLANLAFLGLPVVSLAGGIALAIMRNKADVSS